MVTLEESVMKVTKIQKFPPADNTEFGRKVAIFVAKQFIASGNDTSRSLSALMDQWNKLWGSPFTGKELFDIMNEARL